MNPFPREPAARKAAHEAMKSAAPELMDDIAALRGLFPGAKLTHFQAPGVEYGTPPRTDGWVVDQALVDRVQIKIDRVANAALKAEAARLEKKGRDAQKRKKKAAGL
jgi:hypothetical protein